MKKLLIVLFVLVLAANASAGMKIKAGSPSSPLAPNIVAAWAYNPSDNSSHALLTANLAGIAFGSFPCFFGGVGIAGAGLDGAFSDFTFGMSIPYVTCYAKNAVFQVGMEKPIAQPTTTNSDLLKNTFYVGVGFAFGANPSAKSKILSGKPSASSRQNEVDKLLALQADARKGGE